MARKRKTLDDWEEQHKAEPQNETWFTPPEAAKYLKLGTSTLAKLKSAGKGPVACQVLPNAVRYARSDLDAWMASKRVQPAGE
jgi:predicted DNA-binding transcriptional regulator AlpA